MAQVESKAIGQDELSQILSGNVDSVLTPATEEPIKETEDTEVQVDEQIPSNVDVNFKWEDLEKMASTDEEVETEELEEPTNKTAEETKEKKAGRKSAEFVSLVNELVEAGDLIGFDDGEAKTIEDAKELIKLNVKQSENAVEEDVKQKIFSSYSPQIQAILHYADKGGTDVRPLLQAIAEVEKVNELDVETEDGQIEIIKEYYRTQGWEDEDIKEEIETAKDLDNLKKKAAKLLPKLNEMNTQRVQMKLAEESERQSQIEETRQRYLQTIQTTLSQEKLGDIKLSRQEKGKIWQAVSDTSYKSFNGSQTNAFYKKIEDLQVGKDADYSHFLSLVYFAVDREGFLKKIREEISTEKAAATARQLKVQQNKATSATNVYADEPVTKKQVIQRGFKNPFQ